MMNEEKPVGGSDEAIIEVTENGIISGFEILCRLCANQSSNLISIYSEEGISNDLGDKLNMYLPVKVSKTDILPLQCCFQCASTVLSWHELVMASVEADRRLRNIQTQLEKQIAAITITANATIVEQPEPSIITTITTEPGPSQTMINSNALSPFRHEDSDEELLSSTKAIKQQTFEQNEHIKIEQSTDGEWIKTELVMEAEDLKPFIANCQLTEDASASMNSLASDDSDDDLDPEYNSVVAETTTTKSHLKLHHHHCGSCGKSFRKMIELKKHLKHCCPDEDPLQEQDEEFIGEENNKVQVKREYRCDFCVSFCVRREDLKDHVRVKHPDKFEMFASQKRHHMKRTKIDQDAVNRAKVVVDKRTYYHCDECGKNLHSPYTYIWHNRIHTGERPFVCDLCGKQFRVSQGLVRHLRETHAGIKNFPCDICGRMFATRRNVEEHRRIHTNERPYICDLCGKSFKQKASLFVHNRSHSNSFPFKCSYCNMGFRTRPPLLVHVTRHTGEKPYACDICGRCFRIKYELKRHRLIHSDDKPFACTDCNVTFRQKRYLRNHNKINHNKSTP